MNFAGHILSFLGWSAARAPADTHAHELSSGGRVLRAIANRLLAAIHAHTHRQIELALGDRVGEFQRAIRRNRDVPPPTTEN